CPSSILPTNSLNISNQHARLDLIYCWWSGLPKDRVSDRAGHDKQPRQGDFPMTHSHRAVCRLLCLSLATALLAVAAPAMAQDHGQAAGGDDASVSCISGTTVADLHQLMADK